MPGEDPSVLHVDELLAQHSFPPSHPVDPALPVPTTARPGLGTRVGRRRRLDAIAATQHGLFTVDQARSVGLDRKARHHHLSYGNWRRTAAPSVFRLARWPDDAHENFRAWQLWAGPRSALTSWSGLELLGRTTLGPRSTVHLVRGPSPDRSSRRNEPSSADSTGNGPSAALHWRRDPLRDDVLIDALRVRPVEECLAVAATEPALQPTMRELLGRLIAAELIADPDARFRMLLTGQALSATRLSDAVWNPTPLLDRVSELGAVVDTADEP